MKTEDLKKLLSEMSLEEKVMQLVQLPGSEFEADAAVTGLSEGQSSDRAKSLVGSILGVWGAEKAIALQKKYIENHPHHIPLLLMLDVIHGHKTVFPCPLGQGATFDTEVARKGAEIQAKEASAEGVHVTFSPMADLSRDARWGRVLESCGEDKYLNGRMISAMVEGYQGTNILQNDNQGTDNQGKDNQEKDIQSKSIKDNEHIAACVKHFAAYGGAEAGRDYNNVELSEHTLREQYLPAYEEGIKAGARLVMTSFNPLNGIPSSGNKWLMRDILRDEMGFDGVLISDWAAIAEMVKWGFAKDSAEASDLAMKAGVDIDMCTDCYSGNLEKLIADGKLSVELLDEAVMRVLTLKNDLGLFEDPYRGASVEKSKEVLLSRENREVARDAVQKSLVLLTNKDNVLPLSEKKIAFIGPYVDEKKIHSSWAISCNEEDNVTIKQAVCEHYGISGELSTGNPSTKNTTGTDGYKAAGISEQDIDTDIYKTSSGVEIAFVKGCNMLPNGTDLGYGVYKADDNENDKLIKEALWVAEWADEIVLCLGEEIGQSGESTSRVDITLPKPQMELFEVVSKLEKKLVTLILNGRPLDLKDIPEKSSAVLLCWRPGTEGGHGIMDVLTGKVSPSGKLPMSFPWSVGQEPLHYDHYNTGRPKPSEGASIFSSRYLDCPNEARYPFGFGLTYSSFEVSEVKLSKNKLIKNYSEKTSSDTDNAGANNDLGDAIQASVTLTNTGKCEATETLQLYIRDMVGSRVRPVKELKGFEKVTLLPGESKEVSFEIKEEMLRFFTVNNRFESEPGKFTVYIGTDSATENGAEFTLK